jgi:signal transduction histidine kinase/DNA-binding NarL/FixJ family response regulator
MWNITPIGLIFIFLSLAIVGIAAYAWRQRVLVGLPPFFVLLGNSLWLFGYGVGVGVTDLPERIFWAKFQYLGIAILMVSIAAFSLVYAGYQRWLNWRTVLLLAIIPGLATLLAWTNESHGLIWAEIHVLQRYGLALLNIRYGSFFWFYLAYNYAVAAFSLLVFWRLQFTSTGLLKRQTTLILVGMFFPVMANILYVSGLNPWPGLDLTLPAYTITVLMIVIGLWRYNLLDIMAIPRDKVVEDMPDVVCVLDMRDRVMDINPAGLRLLNLPARQVYGYSLQQLRPDAVPMLRQYQETFETHEQLQLGSPAVPIYFDMRITPIKDWRGQLRGRLIVMRDSTELRLRESALREARDGLAIMNHRLVEEISSREAAQKLVLEQQRTLAALDERERLGRELHDGLGQMMGYLNVETQLTQDLLAKGEIQAASVRLDQISSVVRAGYDDVRAFILGLRPAGQRETFVQALGTLLEQFSQSSATKPSLEYPEEAPEPPFVPGVEVTALHIIRESLANVRKHAAAKNVRIRFGFAGELATIDVEDDGVGYSLPQPAADEPQRRAGDHFGLAMMRERVEGAGGRFELHSTPGHGTHLRVMLPSLPIQSADPDAEDMLAARGLRILLADDHPLFLDGLRNLLQSRGLTVVGLAHDGLEAQALALSLRPDVVVMDVNMPGCDGLEATRNIKMTLPETQVLVLTVSEEEDTLYEAIRNGASGYLLKSLDANEFVRLLAGLSRGETPLMPGIAMRVMRKFDRRKPSEQEAQDSPPPADLSQRQWLILQRVAEGLRYKEISMLLGTSERTIKREMGQVLNALHLENRRDALDFVRRSSEKKNP